MKYKVKEVNVRRLESYIDKEKQKRRCDEKHRHQAQAVSVTGSHGGIPKVLINKKCGWPGMRASHSNLTCRLSSGPYRGASEWRPDDQA